MTPHYRAHQQLGVGEEFDIIRTLLAQWGDLAVDIGDDAAILAPMGAAHRVVSTDACVEHVHFQRAWIPPCAIGTRAVAAAISDLAAMGACADALLLSFIVPDSWRDALPEIARGIADVARASGARIIGGNLSRGDTFSLSTTAIGSAHHVVPRDGARAGDLVVLTGVLGGPSQAIRAWMSAREPSAWSRERFCAPVPRITEGQTLANADARAMIDVSDGIVAEAQHIAAASGVILEIDALALRLGEDVTVQEALVSGEEYELLAVVPAASIGELMAAWPTVHDVPLTVIGRVLANNAETLASHSPLNGVLVRGLPRDDASAHTSGGHIEFTGGHDHFSR